MGGQTRTSDGQDTDSSNCGVWCYFVYVKWNAENEYTPRQRNHRYGKRSIVLVIEGMGVVIGYGKAIRLPSLKRP